MCDNVIIPWSDYFDHIYCFNFLPNVARRKAMEKELQRVGILNSGIFSFFHSSPDPWERCVERIAPRTSPEPKSNIGFINLGLATARALREAKWLGYGRVLFLEDDVRFLKDISALYDIIHGSPWERNIIQYDKFVDWDMSVNEYRRLAASRRIGNTELKFAMGFALNKKGAVLPRLFNGGGTRIRTLEGYANRFTVCPV